MSRLNNPFPYIREQIKFKKVNILLACPLCGKEAETDYTPKTTPHIIVHCANCRNYAVQEEFFTGFDDAEHGILGLAV